MADETWNARERLWLEQIDAANRTGQGWMPDEFAANDEAVWRAAVFDWDALKDGGYIAVKVDQRNGVGKPTQIWGTRLTASGRQAIGRWPDDASRAIDELLDRIDDMIAVAPAHERSKLVRVREALTGVGRDLLIDSPVPRSATKQASDQPTRIRPQPHP